MPKFNNTANRELVQRVPPPQEINPLLRELAHSNVVLAIESSIAAVVFVPTIELFLGNPIQDSLPWVSLVVSLSFGFVIICNWLHLTSKSLRAIASIVEAHAEIAFNRDFNNSGKIGDTKLIEGQSEIVEEDTNATREAFSNHVSEFIKQAPIRGISRNSWVEHRGIKGEMIQAFQWSDGTSITKGEHIAICNHLVKMGKLRGRRKGREGELDYSDDSLSLA